MTEEELVGKRFGRLVVISKVDKKNRHERWLCKCECGNEVVVQYSNLVSGNTASCGCLKAGDLKGKTFGYLTALQKHHSNDGVYWLCKCICGKETIVRAYSLTSGHTKSCGCQGKTKEQTSKNNALYHIWWNMIQRCENPNAISYQNYGARGIVVCDEWKNFHAFLQDMGKGYKKGLQLDRTNNEEGYSPENCKWVTPKENAKNRRSNTWVTIDGIRKLATQWSKHNTGKFLRRHQFDENVLIEGGKYDNTQWHAKRTMEKKKEGMH